MLSALFRRTTENDAATDDGQLAILVLACAVIAAIVVLIGVDVTKVLLARRSLSSAADAAALAAAQGYDKSAVYGASGLACGAALPLDATSATALAGTSLADTAPALASQVRELTPSVAVDGATVTVALQGRVALPMGGVLALLDPALHDGTAGISVTSSARSPVTGC